jgi:hypothetical protein
LIETLEEDLGKGIIIDIFRVEFVPVLGDHPLFLDGDGSNEDEGFGIVDGLQQVGPHSNDYQ